MLFKIDNLSCSYTQSTNNSVLRVAHLEIPRGKVIFLLGASGCGKSTLLETLGLMNNTIAGGSVLFYPGEDAKEKVDLAALWDDNTQQQITDIRKKYYSFIFQNTNLMDNFTAYENVTLSGMIKENVNQEALMPRAKLLMEKIKLPLSEVNESTLAVNLSGGQRQRLAFARAFSNNASVLFCDEPTGNLDEANANELFEIIRNNNDGNKTAIVVSHDINLALRHADQIIVITKNSVKKHGEVLDENIFYKQGWSATPEAAQQLAGKIRSLYKTGEEHKIAGDKETSSVNLNTQYRRLFLKKEGKALWGKKNINIAVLSVIMFFTFLAIGFGNGSLEYLHKKMSSAFVNWLTVSVPMMKSDATPLEKLKRELSAESLKKEYRYEKVNLFMESSLAVWDYANSQNLKLARGRSVDVVEDAKLLQEFVLAEKNIDKGMTYGFRDNYEHAVIVTRRFLDEMHYPRDAHFLNLRYLVKDTASTERRFIQVPVAIKAIVEELPGKYDVIFPMGFIYSWNQSDAGFNTENALRTMQFLYETGKAEEAAKVKEKLTAALQASASLKDYAPELEMKADTPSLQPGYVFDIDFRPLLPDYSYAQKVVAEILKDASLKPYNLMHFYNFASVSSRYEAVNYDQISIYFKELDKIRDFANYFYTKANDMDDQSKIEVDLTKVKEKENSNFLSKVTYIISYLLVISSTIAICLFIFNLLKMHLVKVKMNIGTFKAIGLSDKEAKNIYFTIILRFILIAISISVALAAIGGVLLNFVLKQIMIVEQEMDYFKIFHANTLVTVFIILIAAVVISRITINKMLSKTPGDLIYNR